MFVHVAGDCLDDTNGTIGKVEEEKEHNCVVAAVAVAARTNVVDPVAAAAVNERSALRRVRLRS